MNKTKIISVAVIVFLLGNASALIAFGSNKEIVQSNGEVKASYTQQFRSFFSKSTPTPTSAPLACSASCVSLIKQATASATVASVSGLTKAEVEEMIEDRLGNSTQTVTTQSSTPKESFVTIGSGSTTSQSWETLYGLQVAIDSSKYPANTTAYFEASLRIPTGNGQLGARLINLTDSIPLAETEVYFEGREGKLVTRQFTLKSGAISYGVQVKSSLSFLGVLDLARIKITTD